MTAGDLTNSTYQNWLIGISITSKNKYMVLVNFSFYRCSVCGGEVGIMGYHEYYHCPDHPFKVICSKCHIPYSKCEECGKTLIFHSDYNERVKEGRGNIMF